MVAPGSAGFECQIRSHYDLWLVTTTSVLIGFTKVVSVHACKFDT